MLDAHKDTAELDSELLAGPTPFDELRRRWPREGEPGGVGLPGVRGPEPCAGRAVGKWEVNLVGGLRCMWLRGRGSLAGAAWRPQPLAFREG